MNRDIRILVADDDLNTRECLQLTLEHLGYANIYLVETGQEAFDASRNYKPELILMDTNMPGLKGYEACSMIRGKYGSEITIVGMSSGGAIRRSGEDISKLWLQAGANHFVNTNDLTGGSAALEEAIRKAMNE